jgi:hypothetical protein
MALILQIYKGNKKIKIHVNRVTLFRTKVTKKQSKTKFFQNKRDKATKEAKET